MLIDNVQSKLFQFFVTRLQRTLDYLRKETAKGSRADFEAFLAAVPDDEPMDGDRVD